MEEKFQIPRVCRKCTTAVIGCWAGVSPTSVFAGTRSTQSTPGFENFSSTVELNLFLDRSKDEISLSLPLDKVREGVSPALHY